MTRTRSIAAALYSKSNHLDRIDAVERALADYKWSVRTDSDCGEWAALIEALQDIGVQVGGQDHG